MSDVRGQRFATANPSFHLRQGYDVTSWRIRSQRSAAYAEATGPARARPYRLSMEKCNSAPGRGSFCSNIAGRRTAGKSQSQSSGNDFPPKVVLFG